MALSLEMLSSQTPECLISCKTVFCVHPEFPLALLNQEYRRIMIVFSILKYYQVLSKSVTEVWDSSDKTAALQS